MSSWFENCGNHENWVQSDFSKSITTLHSQDRRLALFARRTWQGGHDDTAADERLEVLAEERAGFEERELFAHREFVDELFEGLHAVHGLVDAAANQVEDVPLRGAQLEEAAHQPERGAVVAELDLDDEFVGVVAFEDAHASIANGHDFQGLAEAGLLLRDGEAGEHGGKGSGARG